MALMTGVIEIGSVIKPGACVCVQSGYTGGLLSIAGDAGRRVNFTFRVRPRRPGPQFCSLPNKRAAIRQ